MSTGEIWAVEISEDERRTLSMMAVLCQLRAKDRGDSTAEDRAAYDGYASDLEAILTRLRPVGVEGSGR